MTCQSTFAACTESMRRDLMAIIDRYDDMVGEDMTVEEVTEVLDYLIDELRCEIRRYE